MHTGPLQMDITIYLDGHIAILLSVTASKIFVANRMEKQKTVALISNPA